jgi:Cys-rich protein (TIGR01571 family)
MHQGGLSNMATWSHDLCACGENCDLCLITFCCPALTAGRNAEAQGEDFCCHATMTFCGVGPFAWLAAVFRAQVRGLIRESRGIEVRSKFSSLSSLVILIDSLQGGFCGDFCTHLFCAPCALVQEARVNIICNNYYV